jgi:two-component system OmpR family sensor kinase
VRRRVTVAMAVMVTAALALAGTVALFATVRRARAETRSALVTQARGLAEAVQRDVAANHRDPTLALRNLLRTLKAPLRLQGATVIALRPDGTAFSPAVPRTGLALPTGLRLATLQPRALLAGDTVSGTYPRGVFAAVPYAAPVPPGTPASSDELVVVLSRSPPTGLAAGGLWYLIAAAVIIMLAVVVADRLGHRFVRPLEAAEKVTGRIAAGDLTARVEEADDAGPELASLAHSINTMAEELARSEGAQRGFLLSVSHELRTPLTSIRGFAEAIEDGAVADPVQAGAVIAAESRRLERLVGDLLDLAKLSARAFALHPVDVVLGDAVEAVVAGFEPEAARVAVGLHVDRPADDGEVVVRVDPDRFAQVVANLTENALSFAASQVRVGWSGHAAPSGEGCVCWVDDDGPGIAAEDLPRVFDRLFTGRPRGDRKVGSGLGLSIVAELVAAMGGSVRAESPLLSGGGGTRIVVTLPATPPA